MQTHDGRLRILHLEDEPNDRELVRATLESEGIACEVQVAATREEFTSAMERGDFDLVLSDLSLPTFDGLTALEIAREKAPEVPFILVSGTVGEEAAIDSLRRGATDYVLKHRLSRLVPAVRRALSESLERRMRRDAEAALVNEQQFLKAVLETLETAVVACDGQGTLTLFNRACREIHEIPEEPARREEWVEQGLYHPDGRTPLAKHEVPLYRALQGEHVRNVEVLIAPHGRSARRVLVGGQPIIDVDGRKLGAVVVMHDITEQKQLEEQLRQAQKMEAIGRLAGSVAHDFNNLLNVILGYGALVRDRLGDAPDLRQKVEQIHRAAERACELTRQLLAFSRKQPFEPRILDLNALLSDMERMLQRLIGADVEMILRSAESLGRVKADPGQIEQVVMNLAVNARDAMPRGGQLVLETANVLLDAAQARYCGSLTPGPYVMMAVRDTGCGMTREVQARAFEPFFTTKGPGKGTGLGLSIVYGIVKQSGGDLQILSVPGAGTTFNVYLPLVDEPAAEAFIQTVPAPARGTETILVVEDEIMVSDLMREGLEPYGYTVLVANDPREAEAACRAHGRPIHLLMTDVVMPGMNGRDLARRLTELWPALKVLYTSGYTQEAATQLAALEPDAAFLQKPFALTGLARKVRQVLDAGCGGSEPEVAPSCDQSFRGGTPR